MKHIRTNPSADASSATPRGLFKWTALLGALCLAGAPAMAAPGSTPSLCVWDPIGAAGALFDAAKTYAIAAQKLGTELKLKAYTDERVASEDFRVGQCDALLATSIRTRPYNGVTVAIDYAGASTIVKDGKIDLDASYDVVRKAIQLFASPAAAKLTVQDRFEVGGIIPMGGIYTFARDRAIFKKGFAGTRMPAFDDDKVQAYLIQRIGAQPVSSDISNFVTKFNNGSVDVIFAPAVAYKPLEIYRGVGTKGGVSRFPLAFSTMQLVLDRQRFPAGFGEKSRQYWSSQFDQAVVVVRKAEADVPASQIVDYSADDATAFVVSQRDLRVELAGKGFYDKQGLKVMKRIRCSVYSAASECSNKAEIDWPVAAQ
ncbi:MAG: hypothetical protein EOP36_06760 [Rubrivivax sp.]|nr:MAG: hypothetical protein EOP36_06760 [Rubrivivax sp.]